jgi:hypothetical protein
LTATQSRLFLAFQRSGARRQQHRLNTDTTEPPSPGESRVVTLEPDDARHLATLCGQFDAHLRQIEERLQLRISARGNRFHLSGTAAAVAAGGALLDDADLGRPIRLIGLTGSNFIHDSPQQDLFAEAAPSFAPVSE